jgi:hypothetical protein
MNCNQIRTAVSTQGFRVDRLNATTQEHLERCELCSAWQRDETLRLALAGLRVPEPSAGFADRVLERAVTQRVAAPARRGWAAAAAVAIAVSGILTVGLGLRELPTAQMPDTVVAAPASHRVINVVINAASRRDDATVTIRLAEDLELEGYAGLHTIEWQTDLEQGRNLLALPVRSKTGAGGDIWVAFSYGGSKEKSMRIQVDAG